MTLPLSTPLASRFEFLVQCGSTNTELVTRAADAWPDFSVLATADQTAGRGRLDRVWVAPPSQTLAVSVLLRPSFPVDAYGWLPLVAGLAMARAVDSVLPSAALRSGKWRSDDHLRRHYPDLSETREGVGGADEPRALRQAQGAKSAQGAGSVQGAKSALGAKSVQGATSALGAESSLEAARGAEVTLKWPNDVQVDGLKVAGLLAELLPAADGVVLGAGLNLTIPADGLPTPNATSLVLHGAEPDGLLDRAMAAYLGELKDLYRLLQQHGGDAEAAGIRRLVEERCGTIGQQVRVELPAGNTRFGLATGIDADGRLVYTDRADASVQTVAAGDVTHLRYE